MGHAQQLVLTAWYDGKTKVFDPVCLFDHKYYLDEYPDYYFIVRKSLYSKDSFEERVCLYREGVINERLRGDSKPFDLWISNELRGHRQLANLYTAMLHKVEHIEGKALIMEKKIKE